MKNLIKKYYIYMILIVVALVVVSFIPLGEEVPNNLFEPEMSIEEEGLEYIYIDIKGEVQNPGVYKVLKDSRLFQLLTFGFFSDIKYKHFVSVVSANSKEN